MDDAAPAQHNGSAQMNGVTAEGAEVLSSGESQGPKQISSAPAEQNGVAHANGIAADDAVVLSLEEGRRHTHRDIMIGTHHFGQRTHGGVQQRHYRAVKYVGKVGWVAKGIVYAIIGGLCCRSAADERSNVDTSPQGAFELLGSGSSGKVLLIIEMAGVALYCVWRFWEGITRQGAHEAYSSFKNFFSFRLSPLVSGFVYLAYLAFCATLVPKTWHNNAQNATNSDFTRSWHKYWYGDLGLAILGIAFLAAFITQMIAVLTNKINHDIKPNLDRRIWWPTIISGHIGSAGRAAFFLLVAILMFRSITRDDTLRTDNSTTFGNALASLRGHAWGRTILFLIGFALIVYGLYCTLIAFFARIFPTPGPTAAEIAELNAAKERKAANHAGHKYGSYPPVIKALHLPGSKK